MICKKHKGQSIPCLFCMKQEYETYGDTPGHDFTQVIKTLKENGML